MNEHWYSKLTSMLTKLVWQKYHDIFSIYRKM